jgi:outer membrane protein assembly factor BamB
MALGSIILNTKKGDTIRRKYKLPIILLILLFSFVSISQLFIGYGQPTSVVTPRSLQEEQTIETEYEGTVGFHESEYYSFQAQAGQIVEVSATPLAKLADFRVSIYDKEGNYIDGIRIDYSESEGESIAFLVHLSGKHTLEVEGTNIGNNHYRVTLVVRGDPIVSGKTVGIIVDDIECFSAAIRYIGNNWDSTLIQPPYTSDKLQGFEVIVVFYARADEDRFTEEFGGETIQALESHVRNGKGLLIEQTIEDHPNLNVLLSRFGIIVDWGGPYGFPYANENYWVSHPIFHEVTRLSVYFGNPLYNNVERSATQLAFTLRSASFIAAYEDFGRVVSITGCLHTISDVIRQEEYYNDVNLFALDDNARLFDNTIKWLLSEDLPSEPPSEPELEYWEVVGFNNDVHAYYLTSYGNVVYTSSSSSLHALNVENGNIIWSKTDLGNNLGKPEYAEGTLFVPSSNKLFAINPNNGDLVWEEAYSMHRQILIEQGRIFFVSGSSWVYSVDSSNGDLLWKLDLKEEITTSPVLGKNKIIVGCERKIFAIDVSSGALIWDFRSSDGFGGVTSPPVFSSDMVFFCAGDVLYAITEDDGQFVWQFTFGGSGYSPPAIGKGSVFVLSTNGMLFALKEDDGSVSWFKKIHEDIRSPPFTFAFSYISSEELSLPPDGGRLVVGTSNSELLILDEKSGGIVFEMKMEYPTTENTIFSGNKLILTDIERRIFAFKPSPHGSATEPTSTPETEPTPEPTPESTSEPPSSPSESATQVKIEEIKLIPQETDKSCWAASSLMILDFYGVSGTFPSQLDLAREIGDESYYWTGIRTAELLLWPGRWQATMERLGKVDVDPEWSGLSFEEVKSELNQNRPLIAIKTKGILSGLTHWVVLVGYDDDQVLVYDPAPPNEGSIYFESWEDLKKELTTIIQGPNGIRTKPQILDGTMLTLHESQHKLYLHVYDSEGRHVGMDYSSGEVEIQIQNAKYEDFNTTTVIVLPSTVTDFRYVVDAQYATNETENYSLIINSLRQGSLISEIKKEEVINWNSKIENTLSVSQEGEFVQTNVAWWEENTPWLAIIVVSIITVSAILVVVKRRSHKKAISRV